MKKLITILAVILLVSCSGSGPSLYEGDQIININIDSIETIYTARHNNVNTYFESKFSAPRGLYNIGDTIHFVKR